MLSKNLKKYRTQKGLTQEALSRKADVSYNTIIKIESGVVTNPRMDNLMKLSNALDVSMDKLSGRK